MSQSILPLRIFRDQDQGKLLANEKTVNEAIQMHAINRPLATRREMVQSEKTPDPFS
jgi:hypothetical protein